MLPPAVALLVKSLREVQQRTRIHRKPFPNLVPAQFKEGSRRKHLGGVEDQDVNHCTVLFKPLPELVLSLNVVLIAREPTEPDVFILVLLFQFRDGIFHNILAPAKDDDVLRSRLSKAFGNGEPDARRATRDQHCTAGLRELWAGGEDGWVGLLVYLVGECRARLTSNT